MKTKLILFCLVLGLIYIGCEDSISNIGIGSQPDTDKISIYDTTVMVGAGTIKVDSVYAKTANGFLGEYYDPSYGTIKSGYACQYYPSIGFSSIDSIVDNKIDSVVLNIYYASYEGDSLAPMELTVYPVIQELGKHYYTNVEPESFCDMTHPMGKQAYTARNLNISDSALLASNYLRSISVRLPAKLGEDYLRMVKNDELKDVKDFLNFFPGTYLTTTFGTGSMLNVEYTEIYVYCTRYVTIRNYDNTADSLVVKPDAAAFTVTKEVIQLNNFKNTNDSFLLENNPEKTYLKSPAGVFTELTIPIREIINGIGKKKFSSVGLTLNAYTKDSWKYSLDFPGTKTSSNYKSKLLLIEPDSVKNFFEQQKIADNQTSYTTTFNPSTYSYNFSNIANVVQNAIDKAPDKDLKLWVIPVQTTYTTSSSYYSSGDVDYMTSNYLYPSGVTLKKGGDNMKVRVIASDLKINK
ncbi:hypothetical protein FACS189426_09080 [Bacteroidia bacterium]|nr:hypothetical protein FACS189426_09080 [Bacteroidia bacterium]